MVKKIIEKSKKDFLTYAKYKKQLEKNPKVVSSIGSARIESGDSEIWWDVHHLGYLLGKKGYSVLSGGGGGLMRSIDDGVMKGGGTSVGLKMDLEVDKKGGHAVNTIPIDCRYFFTRKYMLYRDAKALIGLPGGFGTLDELFEFITLVQTKKMSNKPIILFDPNLDFWQPLISVIEKVLKNYKTGFFKEVDISLARTPEEVLKLLTKIK